MKINNAQTNNEATCLFGTASHSAVPLDCGLPMGDRSFRQHFGQKHSGSVPADGNREHLVGTQIGSEKTTVHVRGYSQLICENVLLVYLKAFLVLGRHGNTATLMSPHV